jgi:hypothetical protein
MSAYRFFWFVTWSTYGTWLPGDPRGFQTWRGRRYVPPPRRYAKPGEPVYDPRKHRIDLELAESISDEPVYLTVEEQKLALPAIVADIEKLHPMRPRIMSLGDWHVHLLAKFGTLKIRPTVGRLKQTATDAIPNPGTRKRIWVAGCHMVSVKDEKHYQNLVNYVSGHRDEGALIHEWPEPED